MLSSGTTSVVELTADVNNLAEKLDELKKQLYGKNKNEFSSRFCGDAGHITTALRDLDRERLLAHDVLEVETIRASVLRHTLNNYASRLKAEIKAVVSSARDSNASLIKELQNKLTIMGQSAQKLVKKHEVMDLHNAILKPELAQLHRSHADKRTILNTKMAERAGMQIILNETEATLNAINAQIAEAEEAIKLAELDLEHHKEGVDKEKAELLVQIDYMQAKFNHQMEENARLSAILAQLEHEEAATGLVRQDSQHYYQEIESMLEEVLATERKLRAAIKVQEEGLLNMKTEKEKLEEDINNQEKRYEALKQEHNSTIASLDDELKKAANEAAKLVASKKVVTKEYRRARDASELQAGALADIKQNVASCKKVLMSESEEGVRLESQVKELEYRLIQLRESHKVAVQLHKEQITDYREKLNEAKTNRATIEEAYNKLQTDIQTEIVDHKEKMNSFVSLKEEKEKESDIILQTYAKLTQEICDYEKSIVALGQNSQSSSKRLHHTRANLEAKIGQLEDKVAELQEQLEDYSKTVHDLEPKVASIREEYNTLSERYEAKKKDIIALKNRKTGLNETFQRLERDLEHLKQPQQKLRISTIRERAYLRQAMENQRRSMMDMERKVKERKLRLHSIEKENSRFREAITDLVTECFRLQMEYDKCVSMERCLSRYMNEIKDLLVVQWERNQDLEKIYSDKDKITLEEMDAAITEADDRLKQLALLHTRFQAEMEDFKDFLEKLVTPAQKNQK